MSYFNYASRPLLYIMLHVIVALLRTVFAAEYITEGGYDVMDCHHKKNLDCVNNIHNCQAMLGDGICDTNKENYGSSRNNGITLNVETTYPSEDPHCHPYMNIRWSSDNEFLKPIGSFHLNICHVYLGQARLVRCTIQHALSAYDCQRVDYPGAVYKVTLTALSEANSTIASSTQLYAAPCHFSYPRNKGKSFSQLSIKSTWRPSGRIVVHETNPYAKIEVFLNMPECLASMKKFEVVVFKVGSNRNTTMATSSLICSCPFISPVSFSSNFSSGYYIIEMRLTFKSRTFVIGSFNIGEKNKELTTKGLFSTVDDANLRTLGETYDTFNKMSNIIVTKQYGDDSLISEKNEDNIKRKSVTTSEASEKKGGDDIPKWNWWMSILTLTIITIFSVFACSIGYLTIRRSFMAKLNKKECIANNSIKNTIIYENINSSRLTEGPSKTTIKSSKITTKPSKTKKKPSIGTTKPSKTTSTSIDSYSFMGDGVDGGNGYDSPKHYALLLEEARRTSEWQ